MSDSFSAVMVLVLLKITWNLLVCFCFYWPEFIIKVKSRGLEEIPVFDISEKTVNGIENKSFPSDDERLASDLIDPVALETPLSKNLVAQISALALQLDSEDLHTYSGSQLFEMHEKLGSMANSIIKNLQSRWRSPAQENLV